MSLGRWLSEKREQVDLLFKFRRAKAALQQEATMGEGFDVQTTLKKAFFGLLQGAAALLVPVLIGYLSDENAIRLALNNAGLSTVLVAALAPLVVGVARFVGNWWKHRDDTAQDTNARAAVEAKIEARKADA